MSKQERRLYEFGPFRLVPSERLLLRDGEPVALTPKAFETLLSLVRRAGRLAEKDELLKEVWPDSYVEESNLAQNVFALRRALGEGENGHKYIETVPKRGYRFLAGVRVSEDRGEEPLARQRGGGGAHAEQNGHGAAATTPSEEKTPAEEKLAEHTTSADTPPVAAFDVVANADRARDMAHSASVPSVSVNAAATTPQDAETAAALQQTNPAAAIATTSGTVEAAPTVAPRRVPRAVLLAVSVLLAVALVGVGVVIARLFLDAPSQTPPPNEIKLSRLMSGMEIWSAAISPDGRHVAHVVENGGETSIWVRQVSTTTDLHIIPPDRGATYWGLTFSRDGDHLYYVKHVRGEPYATLYRVPALGGASRRVITDISSHVGISPDGTQIAFVREVSGGNQLLVANADGSGERRLASRQRPADSFSGSPRGGPSWSPDGQTIATGVISIRGGSHGEVIAVSVADGTERPLTSRRWQRVAQVAWLADGSGLLVAARETTGAQIWHVSYPEGTARKVTNDLSDYHDISLTADSRTLATVQYDRQSTIEFVPAKPPSASKRNTAGMNEGYYGLSWTPDGGLVYAAEVSGNPDIWLMEPDGIAVQQLTTDPLHDSTPSISPDGRSVVFLSHRGEGTAHIWRMDIDGSNLRRLTNHDYEGSPSFTPDGRWVVYAAAGSGIWRVPAEGGEPLLIGGNAFAPSVSPDGSLVACIYREDKPQALEKIAVLPMAGGPPVKIFDKPVGFSSIVMQWTADGSALVYISTRNDVSNLWTLPLDDTTPPRQLTDFTSDLIFNFAWSRDYSQLALARGNTAEHVVLINNFR